MLPWGRALHAPRWGGLGGLWRGAPGRGRTPGGAPEPGAIPAGVSSRPLRTAAPRSSDFFRGEIRRGPRHRTGGLGHTGRGAREEWRGGWWCGSLGLGRGSSILGCPRE